LHIDIQGTHPSYTRDIMLSVIDNGKGVPQKILTACSNPFLQQVQKGKALV